MADYLFEIDRLAGVLPQVAALSMLFQVWDKNYSLENFYF